MVDFSPSFEQSLKKVFEVVKETVQLHREGSFRTVKGIGDVSKALGKYMQPTTVLQETLDNLKDVAQKVQRAEISAGLIAAPSPEEGPE